MDARLLQLCVTFDGQITRALHEAVLEALSDQTGVGIDDGLESEDIGNIYTDEDDVTLHMHGTVDEVAATLRGVVQRAVDENHKGRKPMPSFKVYLKVQHIG